MSKYESQAKSNEKNTRLFTLRLSWSTDQDIIDKLEQQDSMQGYIKSLIRADIAKASTVPRELLIYASELLEAKTHESKQECADTLIAYVRRHYDEQQQRGET